MATIFEPEDDRDAAPRRRRTPVFPGYAGTALSRRQTVLAWLALVAVGVALGLLAAYLPTNRLSLLAIPVAALSALIVWVLPDGAEPPTRFLKAMFFSYFVALTLWPYYLAFDIPGFPLIEIRRAFVALAALALLVSLSMSPRSRARFGDIVQASPLLFRLFLAFLACQVISLPMAEDRAFSLSAFVRDQFNWTAVLLIASYVFTAPKSITRWAIMLLVMVVAMSILSIAEYRNEKILWADHMPSFFRVDDPTIIDILKPRFRNGHYRVAATFPVSLSLAEWFAMTMPFVLYFMFFSKNLFVRFVMVLLDGLAFLGILLTQARVGLIGMLFAHALFLGFWALRARRLEKQRTLLPTAVLSAYPVALAAAVGAIATVPALRLRILGGGAQSASTDSRWQQAQMAYPHIMQRPLNGNGVGHAALTVGWTPPDGAISLDSYILTLLVDYGLVGFAIYVALIFTAIYQGARAGINGNDAESGLAGAAAVALVAFVSCQVALSQEDNASLAFMLIAMIVATRWRLKNGAAPLP